MHFIAFRTGHTQSGLVTCGKGNYEKTTCRTFEFGTWTLSHIIERRRDGHTSWDHDGNIYLLGGVSPETGTSDRVHKNGGSEKSFDLVDGGTRLKLENMFYAKKVSCRFACVIGLQGRFVMTGGVGTEYQVSLYNEDGFLNHLPLMNQGRYDHGCGHYINNELKLVDRQQTKKKNEMRTFFSF